MPVAPFVPLIATGLGVGAGEMQRRSQNRRADQQMAGTTAALGQQSAMGRQLTGTGMPLVRQSGDYYSQLLRGDRSMLRAATAPERAEISDTYRGAERSLSRSGVRGASREYATGELARERAGRLSMLAPQARAGAAAASGNLGAALTGQGGGLLAGLVSGQLGQQGLSLQRDQFNAGQSQILGENIGQLLVDFTKAWQNRQGGGTGALAYNPGGYSA